MVNGRRVLVFSRYSTIVEYRIDLLGGPPDLFHISQRMNDNMVIFMISDGGARVNECISTAADRLHMMPISQVLKLGQLLLLIVMTFFIFEIWH